MGVHRAMDMVLTEANRGKRPIFTYGPLIHNEQVIDLLKSKGVVPVKDISGIKQGTLIIRAHGICGRATFESLTQPAPGSPRSRVSSVPAPTRGIPL